MRTVLLTGATIGMALGAQSANAADLKCPPTAQAMGDLLDRLPQRSLTPGTAGAMGDQEKRIYDGRGLTVLGATPSRIEASLYSPGGPVSSVNFWIPGQDKGRYTSAFVKVAPPLQFPCTARSGCSWWPEQSPAVGALNGVELADSIFEKNDLRFTCRYRMY